MLKNYSSIYNMKDYMVNSVAPKYFNMDDINDLNTGLLGYITDIIGTIADDSFNTTTTYMNEMFPNRAILPETIYTDAALFQEDDFFTKPAEMMAWIFVLESDIVKYATKVNDASAQKQIFLDSDMVIDIEGVPFMMDYNLRIRYVTRGTELLYTVDYDKVRHGTQYVSSISTDNNIYVKSKVIQYYNQKYLAMYVKLHQVSRYSEEHTVVNNDVINAPFFRIPFNDNIASFDVFCKNPGDTEYIQLKKKLIGSAPEKGVPFCYYKLTDEHEFEVSFTIKDGYYKPNFGADIIIDYTTTLGKDGEFELYTGSDIAVNGKSEVYPYNSKLIIFCITQSPSQFATEKMSLEDLSIRNVENRSTVKSYTTENDLDLYFSRFADENVRMYTIKKRNDFQDRLFSTFAMYRNSEENIIKTNTLPIRIDATAEVDGDGNLTYSKAFDKLITMSDNYYFIPAGTVFVYDDTKKYAVPTQYTMDDYYAYTNGENKYFADQSFVYVNPFIICMTTNPTIVGYYINNVNESYPLDYRVVETDESFTQFVCGPLNVRRDSMGPLEDRDTYFVSLLLTSAVTLNTNIVRDDNGISSIIVRTVDGDMIGTFDADGNPVGNDTTFVAKLMFGENATEGYIPLTITHYDNDSSVFTLEGQIKTDNYITTTEFKVTNLVNDNGDTVEFMEDMYNSEIVVDVFINNKHSNRYITMGEHATFIRHLNMCKSDVSYDKSSAIDNIPEEYYPAEDSDDLKNFMGLADIFITGSPFVGIESVMDDASRTEFFSRYIKQYDYIEDIVGIKTNNYNIDIKFYNTYGASKNFIVESGENIDSVGISIAFDIKPVHNAETEVLVRDIKVFIKDYIENINTDNTNSIYVSNLIKSLENNFTAIKYIKFGGITGIQKYDLNTQAIENNTTDTHELSARALREYVPEYLTIDIEDVHITLI